MTADADDRRRWAAPPEKLLRSIARAAADVTLPRRWEEDVDPSRKLLLRSAVSVAVAVFIWGVELMKIRNQKRKEDGENT